MAEAALLQMEAMYGAMAPAWIKSGAKVYGQVREALRELAGFGKSGRSPNNVKANRKALAAKLVKIGAQQK